jgi:hypothetical protein
MIVDTPGECEVAPACARQFFMLATSLLCKANDTEQELHHRVATATSTIMVMLEKRNVLHVRERDIALLWPKVAHYWGMMLCRTKSTLAALSYLPCCSSASQGNSTHARLPSYPCYTLSCATQLPALISTKACHRIVHRSSSDRVSSWDRTAMCIGNTSLEFCWSLSAPYEVTLIHNLKSVYCLASFVCWIC